MSDHDSTGLESRDTTDASTDQNLIIASDGGEILEDDDHFIRIEAADEADAHELRERIVQATPVSGEQITVAEGRHDV